MIDSDDKGQPAIAAASPATMLPPPQPRFSYAVSRRLTASRRRADMLPLRQLSRRRCQLPHSASFVTPPRLRRYISAVFEAAFH